VAQNWESFCSAKSPQARGGTIWLTRNDLSGRFARRGVKPERHDGIIARPERHRASLSRGCLDVEGQFLIPAHYGDGNVVAGANEKRSVDYVFGLMHWNFSNLQKDIASAQT
jgi:hypothetical protein